MIEQQPDLHRLLVQIRDRELLDAVLDDRAGDRERVDLIGLARLALALAGGAHPVRRDAHDPLAGGQQRLLEPARDVPAVLDRPHALLIQAARPPDRGQMPGSSALISRLPRTRPVPSSTAASACEPLCVSAPITIMCTVPSFG